MGSFNTLTSLQTYSLCEGQGSKPSRNSVAQQLSTQQDVSQVVHMYAEYQCTLAGSLKAPSCMAAAKAQALHPEAGSLDPLGH
jgi:hypothetical protein